jgi:hypothetical protein
MEIRKINRIKIQLLLTKMVNNVKSNDSERDPIKANW